MPDYLKAVSSTHFVKTVFIACCRNKMLRANVLIAFVPIQQLYYTCLLHLLILRAVSLTRFVFETDSKVLVE